jgi:hypothetical protein
MALDPVNELIRTKKTAYEGLLVAAAKRYEIPGILTFDDVYTLSLEILFTFVTTYDEHIVNDPIQFQKLFKTELFHRLINEVAKHKAACRDYRKHVSSTITTDDGEYNFLESIPDADLNPEEFLALQQAEGDVDQFILELAEELTTDEKELLIEMLSPRDLPSKEEQILLRYKRTPSDPASPWLLANYLGWKFSKVNRVRNAIRRKAQALRAVW